MIKGAKPCPFCGFKARLYFNFHAIENDGTGIIAHIECGRCEVIGPASKYKYNTETEASADALERWNARPQRTKIANTEHLSDC